jgi:hypothetical protein
MKFASRDAPAQTTHSNLLYGFSQHATLSEHDLLLLVNARGTNDQFIKRANGAFRR